MMDSGSKKDKLIDLIVRDTSALIVNDILDYVEKEKLDLFFLRGT